ncbi:hypothetical protein FSARC_8584 [Fusarium sarcochroum]|uniref:Heterokaryon incompatibility domain-containing protein n=1 Tax=Fusarium sarcochroum TaxID=1208366 RepID=A0A8H4TSU6_9HYPO|nr:hypothetical protein FSARC_8584 [Fusarium sarcochroum]
MELQQPPKSNRVTFQYTPLNITRREIRLLTLSPGEPGSPIFGNVNIVSLDDKPEYEALSYMWGPSEPSYDITINDSSNLSVGSNLRKALDDLRLPDKPRVIWNDAICMNQDDNEEKGHHIQLMRTIYAKSSTVCAWLDHEIDPSDLCFQSLERLNDGVQLSDYPADYWYPLASIFRNPYWQRLWVQQELILASEIRVYCRRYVFDGSKLLVFQGEILESTDGPWRANEVIVRLVRFMVQTLGMGPSRWPSPSILRQKRILLSNVQKRNHGEVVEWWTDLLFWFNRSGRLDMSEPRDRVYGVLGLITGEHVDMKSIKITYDAPVVSVYAQVFSAYLEHTERLCFLCTGEQICVKDHTTNSHRLPSWMSNPFVQWRCIDASNACGSMSAHNARINNTGILCVEGHRLDRVSFVHEKRMRDVSISDWLQELDQRCQDLWPDCSQESLYEKDQVTSLFFPWQTPKKYKDEWGGGRPTYKQRKALLRALTHKAQLHTLSMRDTLLVPDERPIVLSRSEVEVCRVWYLYLFGQVFVGTEGGRLGTLRKEQNVREGDELWILFGCKMPIVLRPVAGQERRFTLVGPAIFHGLMLGEVFEDGEIQGTMIELE